METTNTNQTTFNHDLNHEELKELGLELKSLRARAGLTQDDIVERSNGELKKGTVVAMEKGRYSAGIRNLIVYARILDYKVTLTKLPQRFE